MEVFLEVEPSPVSRADQVPRGGLAVSTLSLNLFFASVSYIVRFDGFYILTFILCFRNVTLSYPLLFFTSIL